jgi:hypothetical protein
MAKVIPLKRAVREKKTSVSRPKPPPDPAQELNALRELIDAERGQLQIAETMLHCVEIALENPPLDEEESTHYAPYYADVTRVIRNMMRKSFDNLDTVHIGRPTYTPDD